MTERTPIILQLTQLNLLPSIEWYWTKRIQMTQLINKKRLRGATLHPTISSGRYDKTRKHKKMKTGHTAGEPLNKHRKRRSRVASTPLCLTSGPDGYTSKKNEECHKNGHLSSKTKEGVNPPIGRINHPPRARVGHPFLLKAGCPPPLLAVLSATAYF